ncbi:hypothetical protein COL48_08795 [Bacillus toyonensis]|uniref:hypothetical protein n=1 Tax=Bacillus toyonensis TaxID=155322 RepID=UPI000BF4237E|nr:hypothetical protein [Bacillus toyonensis]PFY33390.1 hypothetical protein COL48_08795 [Bacillus toyonensis]PHB35373.1 hypothetical protein COE86_12490 [Bacillus toyonensis]QWI03699.1 hypothetical protein EXW54_02850 [Bacillus toyonensis]HDR7385739.1 hypothetical protein [Bacillus toyonensis]
MGYCIYYKKSDEDLKFDNEEHIIPAGLGGIKKLEKGTVSDEANAKFSKEELVILRNSIIGLNRTNNGPGKRGSLNIKKVKNPIMRVMRHKTKHTPLEFVLGFIFAGRSVLIPQLTTFIDYNSFSYQYLASNINVPSVDNLQIELNEQLIQFLEDKERKFKLVHMPYKTSNNFIHIGFYQGRWYVATSFKMLNLNIFAVDMLPILYKLRENFKDKKALPQPNFIDESVSEFKDKLNTDAIKFYFLYLKTAFNALALFKGAKYVCNDTFDEIRESIINVNNTDKFIQSNKNLDTPEIKAYVDKFPDKAHYVIICARNNRLNAYVGFYGEMPAIIELTNKYQGEDFIDGLICDWQNRKESRLENLLV